MKRPLSGKDQHCRNCHHPLLSHQRYCGRCGQKRTTGHVTLFSLLGEFLSTIFNLENRTLSTLGQLVKPGRLTEAYFKGRHKRYGHPVRVFLITLVAMIASISFLTNQVDMDLDDAATETYKRYYGTVALQLIDSVTQEMPGDTLSGNTRVFRDSLEAYLSDRFSARRQDTIELDQITLFGEDSPEVLTSDLYDLSNQELEDKYIKDQPLRDRIVFRQKVKFAKNVGSFIPYMIGRLSWLLLMLLPVLALALKLLYVRRSFYFVEHLIFSMHVHSFIFILLALAIFLQALGVNTEPFWFSLLFIVPLYIYLAMKYFYRQGWGKTLLKYLVIGMIYIFIFSMCSVATLVLGFVFF